MAHINWNTAEFEAQCIGVTLDRLEVAAQIIADDMKAILAPQLTGHTIIKTKNGGVAIVPWQEHGAYATGKNAGEIWTERYKKKMLGTIRAVRKKDSNARNIWIVAGNFKTWWALQMEYGRGGWHGKKKSFMRPAMRRAGVAIQTALEGSHGQTKGY